MKTTTKDPRVTVAPASIAVLGGMAFMSGQVLEGTARTVTNIVFVVLLVAASAWCGSIFWSKGDDGLTRDEPSPEAEPSTPTSWR